MAKKSFLERLGIIERIQKEDADDGAFKEIYGDEAGSKAYGEEDAFSKYDGIDPTYDDEGYASDFVDEERVGGYDDEGLSREDEAIGSLEAADASLDMMSAGSPFGYQSIQDQGGAGAASDNSLRNEFDKLLSEFEEDDDEGPQVGLAESEGSPYGGQAVDFEKNIKLTIDDIYGLYGIPYEENRNIFVADTFEKTLPSDLPAKIRRETVHSILRVSNISVNSLLEDGERRVESLNDALVNVEEATRRVVERNNRTIAELEAHIEALRKDSADRERFDIDQTSSIRYEVQKVAKIMDLLKPGARE